MLMTCIISSVSAGEIAANDQSVTGIKTFAATFRNNRTHKRVLEFRDGLALAENDMIFGTTDQFFQQQTRRKALGLGNTVYGATWLNGVVPYQVSSELSASSRANVISAVEHWNNVSSINLVLRDSSNATDYPNYIDFVNANQCASWVGFQGTGPQSIYTGDSCTEGSMIHEIGHALGLLHEHTRPDRDSYVKINWGNVQAEKDHNFDILSDGAVLLSEYDYGSIMHYGTHFFSSNNLPTIEATRPTTATIGQRSETSAGDRRAIDTLYATDLALTANIANAQVDAGSLVEVAMIATNNAENGANTLVIDIPVPIDSQLQSFSSSAWACSQSAVGARISCTSPTLSAANTSELIVTLSATRQSNSMKIAPQLSSKSHDSSVSNNIDMTTIAVISADDGSEGASRVIADVSSSSEPANNASPFQPVLAAALPASNSSNGGSAGGGSFTPVGLAFMALWGAFSLRRRSSNIT